MSHLVRDLPGELVYEAIQEGARCVKFHHCGSFINTFSGKSDVYLVWGWFDAICGGFWYTFATAIFGWWGIHGLYMTPYVLVVNMRGGNDVTEEVLISLESDALTQTELEHLEQLHHNSDPQSPGDFLGQLEDVDR